MPLGFIVCTGLLIGCPECQAECEKLYEDGPGQCAILSPGFESDEGRLLLVQECVEQCHLAITVWGGDPFGEVGDYDPHAMVPHVALENGAQVESWEECVNEATCEELASGDCQPHY